MRGLPWSSQRSSVYRFPLLVDEAGKGYAASNAYGITSVPSLFLVEPNGSIALSDSGFTRRGLVAVGERAGVIPFRPDEACRNGGPVEDRETRLPGGAGERGGCRLLTKYWVRRQPSPRAWASPSRR